MYHGDEKVEEKPDTHGIEASIDSPQKRREIRKKLNRMNPIL